MTDFGIARAIESQRGRDPDRDRPRHLRLHLARAGPGPPRRRALRHLLARDRGVRAPHRRRAVHRRELRRRRDAAHQHGAAAGVSLQRPEVPRRLEAAIDRALAKDPEARFETMAAFRAELQACLAEVRVGTDTGATGILPVIRRRAAASAPPAPPRAPRAARRRADRARRGGRRLFPRPQRLRARGGGTAAALAAARRSRCAASPPTTRSATTTSRIPRDVGKISDGRLVTAWRTEHYANAEFGNLKSGVGIVLDAGVP